MTRFKFVLVLVFLAGTLALAWAGFDDGKAAYDRQDYGKAFEEFKDSAERGDPQGQYWLAVLYGLGQGVPQDYSLSAKWLRKASDQGVAEAQLNLGTMYLTGHGMPQDYAEGYKWLRKAADQGLAEAQFLLGSMLSNGQVQPPDFIQAHVWLNLAAAQGDLKSQQTRDEIAKKMTPLQITEAQRLADEWKPKGRD